MSSLSFFATCPKGLESLLLNELTALGAAGTRETLAGVYFEGSFQDGMKACLWSRFASRILMELASFGAADDEELYAGAAAIPWEDYFTPAETIAVEFSGSSAQIRNTQYGAVKIKDAVCDHFLRVAGTRPDVNRTRPDVQLYCHLDRRGIASVALDLSGGALLRRDFSRTAGTAPLKENLAAAMVVRSGYDGSCCFCDPMCGSGTLLIEAALLASDTAPGLKRRNFGFLKLKIFEESAWLSLKAAADVRARRGLKAALDRGIKICGFDADSNMVDISNSNAFRAGFETLVHAECRELSKLANPFAAGQQAVIVTNPPYGRRMGNFNELIAVYAQLGAGLKQHFPGCRAAVISGSQELLSCMRLHADKVYKLYNGELECQLRVYSLKARPEEGAEPDPGSLRITAFAQCLRRNLEARREWAQREGVSAYRIYDSEVPEFDAAIDCYDGWYVLQAYAPKAGEEEQASRHRVLDMIAATVQTLQVPGEKVIVKSRAVQHGDSQYEKSPEQKGHTLTVSENDMLFRVNLEDYLDTGLFLDGRLVRRYLREHAQGRDFLNLFAYTGSASVAAALGGARSTLSVDMSRTYLAWALDNFTLNHIPPEPGQHRFVQADVLSWLLQEHEERFDLVYVDPPTFSNSRRMSGSFDISRDQLMLLSRVTRLLKDEAEVLFCSNKRGFKLDEGVRDYGFECEDLSGSTLPEDFAGAWQSHFCFRLKFERACMTRQPEPAEVPDVPKWQKELGSTGYRRGPAAAAPSLSPAEEGSAERSVVVGVWGEPRAREDFPAEAEASEQSPDAALPAAAGDAEDRGALPERPERDGFAPVRRPAGRTFARGSFRERPASGRSFRRDERGGRPGADPRSRRMRSDYREGRSGPYAGSRSDSYGERRSEHYSERRAGGYAGRSPDSYRERRSDSYGERRRDYSGARRTGGYGEGSFDSYGGRRGDYAGERRGDYAGERRSDHARERRSGGYAGRSYDSYGERRRDYSGARRTGGYGEGSFDSYGGHRHDYAGERRGDYAGERRDYAGEHRGDYAGERHSGYAGERRSEHYAERRFERASGRGREGTARHSSFRDRSSRSSRSFRGERPRPPRRVAASGERKAAGVRPATGERAAEVRQGPGSFREHDGD